MSQNTRFPPIRPSDLSKEQKEAYDAMTPTTDKMFGDSFTYKDKDGAYLGPMGPLLETPHVCSAYFELVKAVGAIKGLPPIARETVILATGSHYKAVYETYAHERVALDKTDLTKEQVNMIKVGQKPNDLDEDCSTAFDATIELVNKPGPLGRGTWDRLVGRFGKDGALAVLHYVGLYAYTCHFLNGADVPIPEGESIMS